MWEYGIEYAGKTEKEHGLRVVRRPNIPTSERRYTAVNVPGRDGSLYLTNGEQEDIEIEIELNFIGGTDEWFKKMRGAKRWLTQPGQHKLILGDNTEFFYKVKKCSISETERVCHEIGKFTVTFTCSGYEYASAGQQEYSIDEVSYNPYDISHPTYYVAGEGICDITVNGMIVTANVGQNITINTELKIAYRSDGELQNTAIKGTYEDLYLKEGENTIAVTTGFDLKVIPNWRCL